MKYDSEIRLSYKPLALYILFYLPSDKISHMFLIQIFLSARVPDSWESNWQ